MRVQIVGVPNKYVDQEGEIVEIVLPGEWS